MGRYEIVLERGGRKDNGGKWPRLTGMGRTWGRLNMMKKEKHEVMMLQSFQDEDHKNGISIIQCRDHRKRNNKGFNSEKKNDELMSISLEMS